MLLRESWIFISDNTNVRWKKIFHLYKGFFRKKTYLGFFIKGSARVVEPPRVEYKGFKYKYFLKGDIVRSLIIRTIYKNFSKDTSTYSFNKNSSFLIKKKQDPRSKFLNGPILKIFNRRKFLTLFLKVL